MQEFGKDQGFMTEVFVMLEQHSHSEVYQPGLLFPEPDLQSGPTSKAHQNLVSAVLNFYRITVVDIL